MMNSNKITKIKAAQSNYALSRRFALDYPVIPVLSVVATATQACVRNNRKQADRDKNLLVALLYASFASVECWRQYIKRNLACQAVCCLICGEVTRGGAAPTQSGCRLNAATARDRQACNDY